MWSSATVTFVNTSTDTGPRQATATRNAVLLHNRQNTAEANHKWRTRWKVSTGLVEATSVRRAAAVHCLPFYASRYEEVEKKRKKEGKVKRESCSMVKQQQ